MKIYLDSSVLVSAFTPEVHTLRSWEVMDAADHIFISELTLTEARISIQRKGKRGELTPREVEDALGEIEASIQDKTFEVKPLPVSVFRGAEVVAGRTKVFLRAMDALHIAMAKELGAELFSYDDDQAKVARSEKIKVHTEIP